MPSSHHEHIVDVITFVRDQKPKTILDVGLGWGKWGLLFREYLDILHGKLDPDDWETTIDGIEVYPYYIKAHQSYIYDHIHIGDCTHLIDRLGNYDLIFMGDVLEHIEKEKAFEFLNTALLKCQYFILNIPIGKAWLKQGALFGNKHERHISSWELSDFSKYGTAKLTQLYSCHGKQIALYIFKGAL